MGNKSVFDLKEMQILLPNKQIIRVPQIVYKMLATKSWDEWNNFLESSACENMEFIFPDGRLGKITEGLWSSSHDKYNKYEVREILEDYLINHNLDFALYNSNKYKKYQEHMQGYSGKYNTIKTIYETINDR